MDLILMNDDNMYDYFEALLYDSNTELRPKWKKETSVGRGLTDYNIQALLGAKSLLYEQDDAEKQICLLETMQKFLQEYIGIEGLEELLINNYGTIENSIFLEHDGQGNPVHTREHAKHQMKNAYLGSELLLNYGYLRNMAETIYAGNSITTQYLVDQASNALGEQATSEDIIDKLEELCYKIFMVASMLHDIGYPLEFYLRATEKLTDYPPYLKILSPTIKTDFAEVKAHLQGSQLFKQMKSESIKEKYLRNDHGVLSAVSFLMHFYYNGLIFSLDPIDRCLIEMAAIAIYCHTDRLNDVFRMVYAQDPISYMVRLCDELQEWDRFKLLISDKHNYLQCCNCGKILHEENKHYACECGREYVKVTQIKNRKVNYVCLCDNIVIAKNEGPDKATVEVRINFDYMKQIEILLDDYSAVIRYDKGLQKAKNLVMDQRMDPEMTIDYFVSNNPICIIEKMIAQSGKTDEEIKDWIKKRDAVKSRNLKMFYDDFLEKKQNNPFGLELEYNSLKYEKPVQEYVLNNYGEIYSLYCMLMDT